MTTQNFDDKIKTPNLGRGAAKEAAGGRHFLKKEVLLMVTYSDLIQIGILIVGICSLVFQISKKK